MKGPCILKLLKRSVIFKRRAQLNEETTAVEGGSIQQTLGLKKFTKIILQPRFWIRKLKTTSYVHPLDLHSQLANLSFIDFIRYFRTSQLANRKFNWLCINTDWFEEKCKRSEDVHGCLHKNYHKDIIKALKRESRTVFSKNISLSITFFTLANQVALLSLAIC